MTKNFTDHVMISERHSGGNSLTYSHLVRIPGTGEPGGLPSMGSHGVGHNWGDLAAAAAALILLCVIKCNLLYCCIITKVRFWISYVTYWLFLYKIKFSIDSHFTQIYRNSSRDIRNKMQKMSICLSSIIFPYMDRENDCLKCNQYSTAVKPYRKYFNFLIYVISK